MAAFVVLAFAVFRGHQEEHRRGLGHGLPGDLFAYAYQLDRLSLPAGTYDLDWLPSRLPGLSVAGLSDRQARQLPPELVELEVRRGPAVGEELGDLSGLPRSLESLTVHFGSLRELGSVPPGLRSLSLDRVVEFDPSQLPDSTARLELRAVRVASLKEGLTDLEALALSSHRVNGIDGIQRLQDLRELSLRNTRVDHLRGLPRMLHSLELAGNRLASGWLAPELPPLLVELELRDQPLRLRDEDTGEVDRLPGSLRVLHWADGAVPPSLLAALPAGLTALRLEGSGRLELCSAAGETGAPPLPSLEVLYLSGGVTAELSCLPDGLETLYLEAVDPAVLAEVTAEVQGLGVVNSFGFDLADLGAPAGGLTELDLSFSRPHTAPDFAAMPALEQLRYADSPWTELPALPAGLQALDLEASRGLTSIEGLGERCPRLRRLNLAHTAVSSLADLPESVVELDLRGLSFAELPGLPPRLEVLTISSGSVGRLGTLPASVREIVIADR